MNADKNVKIKEEYSLMQYKSNKYVLGMAESYDNEENVPIIIGDTEYDPTHIVLYDSQKISQAYNDALALDVHSEDCILQYVNKYGLPVTDYDYISRYEESNWLKSYIIDLRPNTSSDSSEFFYDINTLFYTQKAISLLQTVVHFQRDLHNYYFYNENSSDIPVDNIICNIFQDLICVMISLDHNCLLPAPQRQSSPNYCSSYDSLRNKMIAEFKSVKDVTQMVLQYINTARCTNSSLFAYNLFQKLDIYSKTLTMESLLENLFSGKGGANYKFSHGKISIPNGSSYEIDPSFNTKQTLLLLRISEAAINICNKKELSLNELFQQKSYEITFQDILDNYNYPSYEQNRKAEIRNEIYNAAESFYFEIFTDFLVNCPPTVRLEKDTLIYSRQLPNLMQALLNKLYREALIKYKVCKCCGKAFPESARKKGAEYCSDSCSARFRKRQSRETQKQEKN